MSKILGIAGKVLIGLVLFTTFALNLGIVYLLFAPDTYPKPVHLSYPGASGVSAAGVNEGSGSAVATATQSPTAEPYVLTIEVQPGNGVMINTGTKVINLSDPTGRKYLRVTVVLEFSPDNPEFFNMPEEEQELYLTEFNDELNGKMPIINDCITTILSSKTYEDVYTMEGKDVLRVQLIDSLNERLPEYTVIYAYFTEFVVQ